MHMQNNYDSSQITNKANYITYGNKISYQTLCRKGAYN